MLLNCGVGEDSWEPLNWREIQPVHPKGNQSWIFIGRTDAEAETPILWPPDVKNWLNWKRPWYREKLKAGGQEDGRGWDGWMASLTQWTWVWINSGRGWWTGRPGVLQSMESQRVRHDWATELNWNNLLISPFCFGIHLLNYMYFTFPLSRFKTREDQIRWWDWFLFSI